MYTNSIAVSKHARANNHNRKSNKKALKKAKLSRRINRKMEKALKAKRAKKTGGKRK